MKIATYNQDILTKPFNEIRFRNVKRKSLGAKCENLKKGLKQAGLGKTWHCADDLEFPEQNQH